MSELESDLYGGKQPPFFSTCTIGSSSPTDLYGNEDGGEYVVETNGDVEENPKENSTASTTPSKPAENSTSSTPALATKPAPAAAAIPITGAPIQSYTTPLPSDPKPSYTVGQQGAQSIPTYQQPSNYEAGDLDAQHDGAYGGGERSVRPSEMKDEG